jgi:hypothetical protein
MHMRLSLPQDTPSGEIIFSFHPNYNTTLNIGKKVVFLVVYMDYRIIEVFRWGQ